MSASPPVSRTRLPRAEREQQIVASAHGLFVERGFAAVTMEDVAAAVGVTKPLLYAYFGNKEQLYLAAVGATGDALIAAVADAFDGVQDPRTALRAGVRAFFTFVEAEPGRWQVLYDETLPQGGQIAERVGAYRDRLTGVATGLLHKLDGRDDARSLVEAEALAHALLAATESMSRWWLRTGGMPASDAADLLITTLSLGLAGREQETR